MYNNSRMGWPNAGGGVLSFGLDAPALLGMQWNKQMRGGDAKVVIPGLGPNFPFPFVDSGVSYQWGTPSKIRPRYHKCDVAPNPDRRTK